MATLILLVAGGDGRWHAGVGDPTARGWVTFVAYFGAAFACYRAFRTSVLGAEKLVKIHAAEAHNQRLLALLWLGLCLALVLLGINKQLDLQTLFIEVGREMAKAQGWYDSRKRVQEEFIVGLALGGGALGAALGYAFRRVVRRVALALVGVFMLGVFVLVRAALFQHINLLPQGGLAHLSWVLELGGIALVGIAALRASRPLGNANR
jgi:hypothetical protein